MTTLQLLRLDALSDVIFEALTHTLSQYGQGDRFLKVVDGALLECPGWRAAGFTRTHHDHLDRGVDLLDTLQDIQAGHTRHDEIRQDDLGAIHGHKRQALLGIGSRKDLHAGTTERDGKKFQAAWIVIDDDQRDEIRCRIQFVLSRHVR